MLRRGLVAGLLATLVGCGSSGATSECESAAAAQCRTPEDGAAFSSVVVDVGWLEAHLDDADVQLIDTRSVGYETSRIPGAIHLRPEDLSATRDGVSSQVKPAEEAEPVLRAAGLRNDVIAVVYGVPPEYDPSRVVWSLAYYGHEDVRYLDGGYDGWVEAGLEIDKGSPDVVPTDYFITGVDESLRVTGDWVLEQLGDPPYGMLPIGLIDARSQSEYESARIPTALSIDWTTNLGDGFLLPSRELEALYASFDPSTPTVTYCVTGWRASFAWLTLTALGYEDVRLYDGSWSEWGSGDFPVER